MTHTNKIAEYIKLAGSASQGPWEVKPESNRNGTILTITSRLGKWTVARILSYVGSPKQVQNNAQFIAASRTLGPAMAKALIEAEQALRFYGEADQSDYGNAAWEGDVYADAGETARKALSKIQKLKENGNG